MSSAHTCSNIVVTCIDFRFQSFINDWIEQNLDIEDFDRVALGGGVKNQEVILDQVRISHDLHQVKKVILINHEDCGAYGSEGTPQKHASDLTQTKKMILEKYPQLEVETYYLHLDGTFEKV